MIQRIIFLIVVLILFSCNASSIKEQVIETHHADQPKLINYTQQIDGEEVVIEQKEFYANGQLKREGKFEEGKKNGIWKAYFENGQLQSEGQFINGDRTGMARVYFLNGNLRYEGKYKNNKETGHWKFYNKSGKLIREKDF